MEKKSSFTPLSLEYNTLLKSKENNTINITDIVTAKKNCVFRTGRLKNIKTIKPESNKTLITNNFLSTLEVFLSIIVNSKNIAIVIKEKPGTLEIFRQKKPSATAKDNNIATNMKLTLDTEAT